MIFPRLSFLYALKQILVSWTRCGILHAAPQSRDRTKLKFVMAGLDPAIHLLRKTFFEV
jgi:hypothetical protein